MGKSVNKVIIVGNMGQDPEVRYTSAGTAVCNLRIATNESYKDASGEWKERTEWHSAVAWDKVAEVAVKYLTKGSPVYIEGSLQTRSYDDKDGVTKYSTEIRVRDLVLLSSRDQERGDHNVPTQAAAKPPAAKKTVANDDYAFKPNDDLPF